MKQNGWLNSTCLAALWMSWVVLALTPIVGSSSLPQYHFFGISPRDESYYKSSDVIKCRVGSKKFTKAQLNDDFCDCPDGTDEPGTSACPNGRFYCRNAGHVPMSLFSSRVNDGVCDCCDGSDEYDGGVKCPNTCWDAGKVAREKLEKKIAMYKEGVTIRKWEVEQAKAAIAKDEEELLKLKKEEKLLKGLVQQLKERKELIDKAEEKERLQREKEERKKKEAEEKANGGSQAQKEVKEAGETVENDKRREPTESMIDDKIGLLEDSPPYEDVADNHFDLSAEGELTDATATDTPLLDGEEQHTTVLAEEKDEPPVTAEAKPHSRESAKEVMDMANDVYDENTKELSREEMGRLVASRWTGENTDKQTGNFDDSKDSNPEGHDEIPKEAHDEEYDGYASESDDDSQKYGDDLEDEVDEDLRDENNDDSSSYKYESDSESDSSEIESPSNPSWLEKIQQTVRDILQAVNVFQSPVNQSDAAHVRKEYDESSAKLSTIQSRISSLTQKLKHDFGPQKEFYLFYGHCFESKENKYVYKVCPYKRASQVDGPSTTRLGHWDKFEDSYRFMIFSNGDKCWNGPDRSLKVKLRCGLKNEITDVDEPSRCEYVALLSTPAMCHEEKLQELQHKLELMNKEQPVNHDEL